MEELKLSIFTKDKRGNTRIIHTKWDKNDPSYQLEALHTELLQLIKETNASISEEHDRLSELKKKRM